MTPLSSLKLTPATPLDKTSLLNCSKILKILQQNNQSSDFKQPVDWKNMNLTDYPSIVKHPMDLGTVDKKLKAEKYQYLEEFLDDVQLIWDNCKLYNRAGSWICLIAERMERYFKKMVKNYFTDINIVIPQKTVQQKNDKKNQYQNLNFGGDEDITYLDKLSFCEKVQKLEQDQLEKLIKIISEKCPEVLKQCGEERVQIIVDNFTPQIFQDIYMDILQMADGQIDRLPTKKVKLV